MISMSHHDEHTQTIRKLGRKEDALVFNDDSLTHTASCSSVGPFEDDDDNDAEDDDVSVVSSCSSAFHISFNRIDPEWEEEVKRESEMSPWTFNNNLMPDEAASPRPNNSTGCPPTIDSWQYHMRVSL